MVINWKFKSKQMPYFTFRIGDKSGCFKNYFFEFMKVEFQSKLKKDSVRFSVMLCGLGWPLVTEVLQEPIGTLLKASCWKFLVDM